MRYPETAKGLTSSNSSYYAACRKAFGKREADAIWGRRGFPKQRIFTDLEMAKIKRWADRRLRRGMDPEKLKDRYGPNASLPV